MSSNPNDFQHGGDHYGPGGNAQHWDMLPACGYGWEYYKGRATAYLTRVKQPELDPLKAQHFIEKLIWLVDKRYVPAVFVPTQAPRVDIMQYLRTTYFPANKIHHESREATAIGLIMTANCRTDLQNVMEVLAQFAHALQKEDPARPLYPSPAQREAILDREADEANGPVGWQEPDPVEPHKREWPFADAPTAAPAPAGDNRVFLSIDGGGNDDMCSRSEYSADTNTTSSGGD